VILTECTLVLCRLRIAALVSVKTHFVLIYTQLTTMNCAVRSISLKPVFLSTPIQANLSTPTATNDPKPPSPVQYPSSVSAADAHYSSRFSQQPTTKQTALYSARLAG
jgi:hypothetical protein